MRPLPLLLVLWAAIPMPADISGCACDPARPETLAPRQCDLCREAEKQPPEVTVFFLQDSSPRKPNRWLALPRVHEPAGHPLYTLTARQRLELWSAAITKAKALWGDDWGLAVNGSTARSQCHTHIHIGKLLHGVETGRAVLVDGPARIPAPADDSGLWVHPQGRKLHVHLGEQITETVLLR